MNRYVKKVIRGVVSFDKAGNPADRPEISLKGIKIKLFSVKEVDTGNEDVTLFKHKLVAGTRTDENGKYLFLVGGDKYSVSMDIDTLPFNTGIACSNIYIDRFPAIETNFKLTGINSIDIKDGMRKVVFWGDEVSLEPAVIDDYGNAILTKVNYTFDDAGAEFRNGKIRLNYTDFREKTVNVKIEAGNVSKRVSIDYKIPDIPSVEKIILAYENIVVDEKTKIMYYLHTLFDKDRLADEFKSDIPLKSGTTAVKEIHDYIGNRNADPDLVKTAKRYLASAIPDLDKVYTSPDGYFKIHYTLSGSNAVSSGNPNSKEIPGYIKSIGAAFDRVKSITCSSRGFRGPIPGSTENKFDIYVYDLKGKYGITFPSSYYKSDRSGVRTASSYISIDNRYSEAKGFKKGRDDCMKVTAAHEFFHAVQNAYDVDADSWWKEASATWNEDEIYSGINDYVQYLKSIFSSPEKSLEKNSYSGVLFAKYLAENWGGNDIIKRIWEMQGTAHQTSLNVIDKVIKERYPDQNIGSIFNRFTAYNYNPPQYYKEGDSWDVRVAIRNTYSAYPVEVQNDRLDHLSACYQLFKPDASSAGKILEITIDGADKKYWGFKIQRRRQSKGLCDITDVETDGAANRVGIVCKNFGEKYKEICLIPANLEKGGKSLSYTYSADIE